MQNQKFNREFEEGMLFSPSQFYKSESMVLKSIIKNIALNNSYRGIHREGYRPVNICKLLIASREVYKNMVLRLILGEKSDNLFYKFYIF